MRLSRPCYDKYWRCPGWAGGGPRSPKGSNRPGYVDRCDDGRIKVDWEDSWWAWKFWRCNKCDVVVLPYWAKMLSPFWLWYLVSSTFSSWRLTRRLDREYRERQERDEVKP